MKKCFETNADTYMALLQIRLILNSPCLPNQAMLLFNALARGILPTFTGQPVLHNNDEINLIVLFKIQPQASQDRDTHKNIPFLPTGSTVAVQTGDVKSYMHGVIIGHGTDDYNGRSYRVRVTEIDHVLIAIKIHIKSTNKPAENYL